MTTPSWRFTDEEMSHREFIEHTVGRFHPRDEEKFQFLADRLEARLKGVGDFSVFGRMRKELVVDPETGLLTAKEKP